ncbi:MAG: DUF4153 domain-containing protein, partial [Micavibrio sp.]|nr:DUF4153 domain-containing protein [Micavibrio sp.]
AAGVLCFSALAWSGDQWAAHFCYIFPALLLGVMFAPFLRGGDDLSVWFYNRKLWVGVAISYIALILLAGGASTALWAVEELFDLDFKTQFYSDIWAFAGLVVGPIYALYWVPERFKYTQDDCNDPPGLKFIVNWISAPMVFVYLAILYAYFARIIITGEVPNGHLAYMISGFIGAGVVTYLAAHPLRNEGTLQLRALYKVLFMAMIVPVGFHIYAIWERIGAYGVTEQRYMLALAAVWFAFLAFGNLRGRLPIRVIPMVLAALLVLASFGPWGAVSVSGKSQLARLEALLDEHGLVVDGKVVKAKEDLALEVRADISSILAYLCHTDRDAMLKGWFELKAKSSRYCNPSGLAGQLGFDYVSQYEARRQREDNWLFYLRPAEKAKVINISKYDLVIRDITPIVRSDELWSYTYRDAGVTARYEAPYVIMDFGGETLVKLDVAAFAKVKKDMDKNQLELYEVGENETAEYRFDFGYINGEHDGEVNVRSMEFDFYYRLKD